MTVVTNAQLENRVEAMRKEIRSLAAKHDVDGLAQLPIEQLQRQRDEAAERVETRSNRALDENRDATDREDQLSKSDLAEIEALDAALLLAERNAAQREKVARAFDEATRTRDNGPDERANHPSLRLSAATLRAHADAITNGTTFAVTEKIETRAAITAGADFGSAGTWGSSPVPGPVTLRAFAGIPSTTLDGSRAAEIPTITLPQGVAGVTDETAAHDEFDAADKAALPVARFGRWTDVTSFVDAFSDLSAIDSAQAVGVGRDLTLADVTSIEAAAGTPAAFDATTLDQNVRQAVLTVAEAVLVDPSDVVLVGDPASLAIVTGYAPASGGDRGSVSTRVYGARVFATAAATAGIVTAFAPLGFRVFQTAVRSASVIDPTTGGHRFGKWMHSTAAGLSFVGAASAVDVVTP